MNERHLDCPWREDSRYGFEENAGETMYRWMNEWICCICLVCKRCKQIEASTSKRENEQGVFKAVRNKTVKMEVGPEDCEVICNGQNKMVDGNNNIHKVTKREQHTESTLRQSY